MSGSGKPTKKKNEEVIRKIQLVSVTFWKEPTLNTAYQWVANLNFRAKIDPTLLRFFDEEAYGKLDGDKSVDVKEKQSLTNF